MNPEKILKNFMKCGFAGWGMEILFTALHSLQRRDMTLKGTTSVWMFPIYGTAAFLQPVCRRLSGKPALARGFVYALCIFLTEYCTGRFLWKRRLCPWDYGSSRYHIGHVIRLDFAPYWIAAGLFFEQLLKERKPAELRP